MQETGNNGYLVASALEYVFPEEDVFQVTREISIAA